ncbi:uncharacterized protein LOC115218400 [Octopus sinensis]|uniref:Uncharacterized protein LOC115218400 n=1 Tax=Octopus sinensis TaxID=2607531 RepID=A0A6P7T049_9MOLL|nr:uncharacterized protein LOC115218400 [Octopus sinensis]XP_036364034.1 uncharacterized protein LOC115218400 [Octopus sinensis]XP_036364035.1 uncharacterized protein LOC115218400 [Octopus sinensis]
MDHFSRHFMRWLLFLLLLPWTNCISFSRVTPENPYVLIGNTLELNCTISGLGLGKVSQMYFTHNTTTVVPKEFTRALDISTLQLNMTISSPRDAGKYTCLMSAKPPIFTTHISPPHVIGSQFVEVEYKVQSVRDIDCRVYNWEKMTCTWDLGTRYLHMDSMNVTLGWTISKRQYNCLHQTPTSCTWYLNDGAYSFQPDESYRMQITVRNRRKKLIAKSKIFYIYSALIVKPAKLRGIKCQPYNSSCTNLSWNHTHPLKCRVRYHSQWDPSNIWEEKDVTRKSFLLCGLTPYTMYNFSISCLPQLTNKPFWSDKTKITFKTPSEVPEKAPAIPGTYFRMVQQTNKHCSQVILYWKKVPLRFQYGKPQGFLIQYRPKHENWMEVEVRQGLASAMICLRADKAYELRLYARNDVNFSTGYSTLFIETVDGRPGQPVNFTAETLPIKGTSLYNLTLSWGRPSVDVKGLKSWRYLLMWCHKSSNIIYNCEDDPQWIHLPNSILEHSMKVKGRFMKNLIFGLATKATFADVEPRLEDGSKTDYGKNISSGLVWAPCIFRKDWKPLEAPSGMNFGDITDKSLLINWDAMKCEESPTQIIEYLIHYCPINSSKTCHGPASVAHVRGNDTSYILTDLTPGLQYRVWMQAVSPAGEGPVSLPIFSVVVNDKLTSEAIAAIIISIIILICLILSCICAVRKLVPCRRKYNGIEIDCRIDNLPSLPDEPLYYDDEFDRKSIRRHLPSTKSYDSDDRCSVHTQNSPTAETPLITEPKKRNKTNKAHSPKLSRNQQPSIMEKRTSATWSPRSSTNLEGLPTEVYLDGSRSSPVTLSKPIRTRQMPVFNVGDSQCPVGRQQPSLLDTHYMPGEDWGLVQDSIETIHPIRPLNDGYSYVIPDTNSYSGWTSHSSLDTPSNGNNNGAGSNGNLLYSLNGLSSTTIDSQGETVSSHYNSSPYHMSPPKDLYFSSQSSIDNIGHQSNKVSLLDLHDLEEECEPVTTNGDFHFNNIQNPVPGNTDVYPPPRGRQRSNDKFSKEPDAHSKFEPLSKLDEQILLKEGGDCIALKTYKTNANCKSDPALVKVRLPEERNGELPPMLNRFMAHHELIPYHSTALPMQGNSEPPPYCVKDLIKQSEDVKNDGSDYFIRDRNTSCDNNSKKKSYSPKKKNSGGANHSSFGNKGNKSNSVHSKKPDNPHSIRKRPDRKALPSSKEKSNELKTFASARTTDGPTLPEELPAHYFRDPEITPDLPTTDL